MNEYGKALREILHKHGCRFVRHGKGDHDIWRSPFTGEIVVVDGEIKSRHLANKILKKAGINHRFP
ncbi:MAG: type II toxin-antitoxin system HicA family toxin [Oscillospiraceae bacterium]|nr:type II toxin-antitoxin system HicA family toxin [Oscillospiraceae bacterium]